MMQNRSPLDELAHATWSLDLAVAGLLFVVTVLPTAYVGLGRSGSWQLVALLGAALCGVVVLRRRRPMLTLAATTLLCLAHLLVAGYPTPPLVCVLLVAYSVARWVPGHRSRVVLVLGLVASLVGPARWLGYLTTGYVSTSGFPLAFFVIAAAGCLGLVVTCYAIGRRVRVSALADLDRARAAVERRALEVSEAQQSARVADANVRSQIARELHDIVAHSLSVMIVQAEGGRALAAKKPEQAAEVLDTIAETGREALSEMRRIVDVLRGEAPPAAEYAPTPGLAEIAEMVQRSGADVELVTDGEPPQVGTALGLTVFRVVQEALTNVLKHAGPGAHARVSLSYSPALIVAEVTDDGGTGDGPGGGGALAAGDGRGHGLQGMQERVAAMNGQLLARPREGGGFLVRAILPVPLRAPDATTNPGFPTTQEMR